MGLRSLNHEMLYEVDINYLLTKFSKNEIALIFKVQPEYVTKVRIAKKIIAEEEFEKGNFGITEEMDLGNMGAWMGSKERKYIKQFRK
mgnify:CR=1 FL=1|tara:strand:- start:2647 stop:2910 length:264 start_codon:yes stop_codon:yes gene_type:complete